MAVPASLPQPTPAIVSEFRSLVDELYGTRKTKNVAEINDLLLKHQRSDYAYALAANLFESAEPNHKYFAALTIALKSTLSLREADEQTNVWLIRLILHWFAVTVDQDLAAFVLQRVTLTIVIVFLNTSIPWQNCVKDVFVLFVTGDMNQTLTMINVDLQHCINEVSDVQMKAVLVMFTTLAEECRRLPRNANTEGIYRRIGTNHHAVAVLLKDLYDRMRAGDTDRGMPPIYSEQALNCHQQWMKLYRESAEEPHAPAVYSELLPYAMKLIELLPEATMSRTVKATTNSACELIEAGFKDDRIAIPQAVDDVFIVFLQTNKASMYLNMDDGFVYESDIFFKRMVLAYCRRAYRYLFLPPGTQTEAMIRDHRYAPVLKAYAEKRQVIVPVIKQVSMCLFHRMLQEDLVMEVLDFWDDFIQDTREYLLKEEVRDFAMQAIDAFCAVSVLRKVTDEEWDFSDETENEIRADVRLRVRDLLQVCCEEYGIKIFEQLLVCAEATWTRGYSATRPIHETVYYELEPPLYFMVELAESLRFASSEEGLDEEEEGALARLFQSHWFSAIFHPSQPSPTSLRKLALRAIGEFKLYFGRRPEELWKIFDLLIDKMRDNDLAAPAAVSMRNLSDENRELIAGAGKVDGMLSVCAQYFSFAGAQREPKGAIVGAVASVSEAMKESTEAGEVFRRLLEIVAKDHDRRLTIAEKTGSDAMGLGRVVCRDTLVLMVNIGRCSQAKDDEADVVEVARVEQTKTKREQFWRSQAGIYIQEQIGHLLRSCVESTEFSTDSIALASDVLRTGYREQLAGPFVFQPSYTIDFIDSMPENVSQLTLTRLLAEFITSQQSPNDTPDAESLSSALKYVYKVVGALRDLREEPELTSSCLDAVERLSKCSPETLLRTDGEALRKFLEFSVTCLQMPEPLPKRAAASFWTAMMSASEAPKTSKPVKDGLKQGMSFAGQPLTIALVANFAGGANRGDLNRLVDTFRFIIKDYKDGKTWLEAALGAQAPPNVTAASEAERKRFKDTVVMLRGSLKTRQAVADFWGKCKGLPTDYAT